MPSLTPELIANFPLSHYADPGSIQRGRAYYKDDRAWNVELVNAGNTASRESQGAHLFAIRRNPQTRQKITGFTQDEILPS